MHIPAEILARLFSHVALLKLALAKQYGLNAFQFLAVVVVGHSGRLSIGALREKLAIPGSSLTFTLDSLEKKGLIRRCHSQEDRRQWLLSLSAKGKELYGQIIEAENNALSPALARLSDAEKAAFLKIAEEITKTSGTNRTNKPTRGTGTARRSTSF